jgi:dTDP-4-amino-4,6-dideoxygalactose transaminase
MAQWSMAEGLAAMEGWLAPGRARRRLEDALADVFGGAEVHAINAGRTALALILRALKERAPERDELVLPGYVCPSVTETVLQKGLRLRPVDIGPDLNLDPAGIAPVLGPRTLAVLAVHMYGAPAAIGAISALCRDAGVPLIDDAAQVFGEVADGALLGTFGAAGLVSFAQSKAVVAGYSGAGGLLIVNDPALREPIRALLRPLPDSRAGIGAFLGFLTRHAGAPMLGARSYLLERILPEVTEEGIGEERISGVHAAIATRQIVRYAERRTARVAELAALARAVAQHPGFGFPQFSPGRWLSRPMLRLPEGVDAVAFRTRLRDSGIFARGPYPLPEAPASALPMASALVARLVEFPLRLPGAAPPVEATMRGFATALARAG